MADPIVPKTKIRALYKTALEYMTHEQAVAYVAEEADASVEDVHTALAEEVA